MTFGDCEKPLPPVTVALLSAVAMPALPTTALRAIAVITANFLDNSVPFLNSRGARLHPGNRNRLGWVTARREFFIRFLRMGDSGMPPGPPRLPLQAGEKRLKIQWGGGEITCLIGKEQLAKHCGPLPGNGVDREGGTGVAASPATCEKAHSGTRVVCRAKCA
ncbi:hypothetical protein GCM10010278_79770 [Streptomyces melanogenes]|nr:hypothetical protein GCM10010278_79770 [Streptomyces melanogenes]